MALDNLTPAARRGKRGQEIKAAIAAKDAAINGAVVSKSSAKRSQAIAAKATVTRLRNLLAALKKGKMRDGIAAQLAAAETRAASFA